MVILAVSVIMTLCYIPGLLLRYVPFKSLVDARQKRILFAVYAVVFVLNVLVMFLVFSRIGLNSAFLKADLLAFGMTTALVNILVIRGRTKEHLFVYGIVVTCNYLIVSIPTFLTGLLVGLDSVLSYIIGVLAYGLLLAACYWPTRNLLRNTVEPFLALESGDYWETIWFIPVAMFFSMMFAFPGNVHVETVYHLISRALMGAATILMCLSIAKDHKRLEERQRMTDQLTMQKVHYAQLQQRVEDARRNSHDFKHHIAAIQHFIDTDDKDGIQNYCNNLSARTTTEGQIPYTGNAAADGVLYRYMQLAQQHNVKFHYSGRIKSGGIADMDICVLLGNALDNALAGCLTVSENRSISVIAQTEAQILSVVVQNCFDGEVRKDKDTLLSRKRDNAPGVGLSSMRSICERYGGTFQPQWDEDTFTVLFVLPVEQ